MSSKVTLTPSPALPQGGIDPRAHLAAPTVDTTAMHPKLGMTMDDLFNEIDECFRHMSEWHNAEPDEVMRYASGYSARFSYIRVVIQRTEDYYRHWKDVRTKSVEPLLEELREQWKNGSRLHAVREFDYMVETGRGNT